MPTYKSKPHEIEAFQFVGKGTIAPDWILEAEKVDRAQLTMNNKDQYISLYSKKGDQHEKAFLNWWICYKKLSDEPGDYKLYALSDKAFRASYDVT